MRGECGLRRPWLWATHRADAANQGRQVPSRGHVMGTVVVRPPRFRILRQTPFTALEQPANTQNAVVAEGNARPHWQ